MPASRSQQRERWPLVARIEQLENELDEIEAGAATLRTMLITALVTTATAAIMLAINVLVERGGSL